MSCFGPRLKALPSAYLAGMDLVAASATDCIEDHFREKDVEEPFQCVSRSEEGFVAPTLG